MRKEPRYIIFSHFANSVNPGCISTTALQGYLCHKWPNYVSLGLYPVSSLKSFFYFIGLLVYPRSNTTLSHWVLVSGNVSHLLAMFVFNYRLKNEDHIIFLVNVSHTFRIKSKLLLGLTMPFMLWPLSTLTFFVKTLPLFFMLQYTVILEIP